MHILLVAAARPNFMKVAPLLRACKQSGKITQTFVHTGQHYDAGLSGIFLEELSMSPPDIYLGIHDIERDLLLRRVESAFGAVVDRIHPDAVVVVGDVNSTLACARAAQKRGVRLAHVEAGLRSFDSSMPEELNRVATDAVSDLLFVSERAGMENLKRENVGGRPFLVGNVMIDTLMHSLPSIKCSDILTQLSLPGASYCVATFHRPENVDSLEGLSRLQDWILSVCKRLPVVLPLHPRTRASLERHSLLSSLEAVPNLTLCDPLGYFDFMRLVLGAKFVVTDSGGIQEETTFLGIPCITARRGTERPITVELGTNVLVGHDPDAFQSALAAAAGGRWKEGSVPELWDGAASERIVAQLLQE